MLKKVSKLFLVVVIVNFIGCWRDGPLIDKPVGTIANSLDQTVPVLMGKARVVGLSMAVVKDNQVKITKSFGYADIESNKKIDENTIYRAASLGKPIFAYIVVALAQKNQLDLDNPLFLYTGEEVVTGDPRSKTITARMVLSHTTGLPNLGGDALLKFDFEPDSRFQYSGHAYQYLQRIIENITQKSLNQLAAEIVFEPLSMSLSSYRWRESYEAALSSSYDGEANKYSKGKETKEDYAAWSLYTTLADYSKFVTHIMRSSIDTDSIASQLLQPRIEVAKGVKWGLGWGIQSTRPHESFWHWGSKGGFKHYVVAYPIEKTAVIVMANSKESFKIVDEIMVKSIGGSYPSYDWF